MKIEVAAQNFEESMIVYEEYNDTDSGEMEEILKMIPETGFSP